LKKDDPKLDEILGRGLLGGPEYEEILKRVLERTVDAPAPPAKRRRVWMWALFPLAAGVALAGWLSLCSSPTQDRLVAKGSPEEASGALDIGCAASGRRSCRSGDTLLFTVNSALTSGYLGAYAERIGHPGAGGRIWYFPGNSGTAPFVAPGTGTVVLPEGIEIGADHLPGSYRVTLWISDRPLDRNADEQAASSVVRSRSRVDLEVAP
jgi:hypothetical protein